MGKIPTTAEEMFQDNLKQKGINPDALNKIAYEAMRNLHHAAIVSVIVLASKATKNVHEVLMDLALELRDHYK